MKRIANPSDARISPMPAIDRTLKTVTVIKIVRYDSMALVPIVQWNFGVPESKMPYRIATFYLAFAAAAVFAAAANSSPAPPKAGPVQIMKSSELKPGMTGTAWTVFTGTEPEPVPIEIIGLWKNAWGPKQDVIIAKMGGKAQRTNVAGGMSGSPVYIDGKLIGAVALRLSVFSPDSICGITPIELMLEIND